MRDLVGQLVGLTGFMFRFLSRPHKAAPLWLSAGIVESQKKPLLYEHCERLYDVINDLEMIASVKIKIDHYKCFTVFTTVFHQQP